MAQLGHMSTVGLLALMTLLIAIVYLIYGIILSYHWIRYSASWGITTFSLGAYIVSGLYLIGLMATAILTL